MQFCEWRVSRVRPGRDGHGVQVHQRGVARHAGGPGHAVRSGGERRQAEVLRGRGVWGAVRAAAAADQHGGVQELLLEPRLAVRARRELPGRAAGGPGQGGERGGDAHRADGRCLHWQGEPVQHQGHPRHCRRQHRQPGEVGAAGLQGGGGDRCPRAHGHGRARGGGGGGVARAPEGVRQLSAGARAAAAAVYRLHVGKPHDVLGERGRAAPHADRQHRVARPDGGGGRLRHRGGQLRALERPGGLLGQLRHGAGGRRLPPVVQQRRRVHQARLPLPRDLREAVLGHGGPPRRLRRRVSDALLQRAPHQQLLLAAAPGPDPRRGRRHARDGRHRRHLLPPRLLDPGVGRRRCGPPPPPPGPVIRLRRAQDVRLPGARRPPRQRGGPAGGGRPHPALVAGRLQGVLLPRGEGRQVPHQADGRRAQPVQQHLAHQAVQVGGEHGGVVRGPRRLRGRLQLVLHAPHARLQGRFRLRQGA
mmetsp:Transcript_21454/g.53902  ORF Transcript_21454/g.53902 Transcript_21454/m.53902 type:complete len:476 (+) Transcript_21454:148-1575(+)